MTVLCLIPARGGSKGLPRKNLRLLGDRPLLAHSVEHALGTSSIGRVVVSTDDDEIASIAKLFGAEVVRRPTELSGDSATSEAALLHALDQLLADGSPEPELVVFLQATSPLRKPDDIERAIEVLRREKADSLFSACPAHGFVWRRSAGQRWKSVTYDFEHRKRRQEFGQEVTENGSIYVFKPWVLRQLGNRLGGEIAMYPMAPLDSFQVDEPQDFVLIEELYSLKSL